MEIERLKFLDRKKAAANAKVNDSAQRMPHPEKAKILKYLRSAPRLYLLTSVLDNDLDVRGILVGRYDIATDGVWAWSVDVADYVKKQNLKLPDDFIERMRRCKWVVPKIKKRDWKKGMLFYQTSSR
jgi:hypothetical protein